MEKTKDSATLPSIYSSETGNKLKARLEEISKSDTPQWGKMNAPQMLAHLNAMFDVANGKAKNPPNAFTRLMLKTFVKRDLVNEKPYKKNSMTAPQMLIKHQPDFQSEKMQFIVNLNEVIESGSGQYDQKNHPAFGILSDSEWSNLFYKHIDHHFTQFAV